MSPKAPAEEKQSKNPAPVFRDRDPKTMNVHERNLLCAAISFSARLMPYCPVEAMNEDPKAAAEYTKESLHFMKGPYAIALSAMTKRETAEFIFKQVGLLKQDLANITKSAEAVMEEVKREEEEESLKPKDE